MDEYKNWLYVQAETYETDKEMVDEEERERELLEEDLKLERAGFTRTSLQEEMYGN